MTFNKLSTVYTEQNKKQFDNKRELYNKIYILFSDIYSMNGGDYQDFF